MSRLIDADSLIHALNIMSTKNDSTVWEQCISIVNSLPNEERHGRWVKSPEYKGDDTSGYIDNHWTCSECGKEAIVNEWYMYDLTDYCPFCGAKMGEEIE